MVLSMESYATSLFLRLPEAKQCTILTSAAAEFARLGYTAAKVDDIAARAGISVGALYKYFKNKENCFLAVLEHGMRELEDRLNQVIAQTQDPWERIEAIVRLIPAHSREHAEIIRLYQEIGSEGLSSIAEEFCRKFEGLSASVYSTLLAEARDAGMVRPDIDERMAAFCLDNVFMALQFSYACGYHSLRKKVYLGDEKDANEEALIEQTMAFLRYGLAGR